MGMGTEQAFNWGQALNIGGGVFSALQAYQQGKAEGAYYDFQAGQYDRQARDVMTQAHEDTVLFREGIKRLSGTQRAQLAAGGMAGSQTAMELISDTARQAELDALAIKYNANLKAEEARTQAEFARMSARNARAAGRAAMFTSLIGTAGQVADYWYQWKQTSKGAKKDKTRSLAGSKPVLSEY